MSIAIQPECMPVTADVIRNLLTAVGIIISLAALTITLYDRYAAGTPLLTLRFITAPGGDIRPWLVVKNVGSYDVVIFTCTITPTGLLALSKSDDIHDLIAGQVAELGDVVLQPGEERAFLIVQRYEAGHLAGMGRKNMRFTLEWRRTRSMTFPQWPLRMFVPAKDLERLTRKGGD